MTRVCAAIVGFLVLAGPALAGDRCIQPYAPTIKVNATTTKQDMLVLHGDVVSFVKASEIYESCLSAANNDDPKIDASEAQKERVAQQYNAAMHAFQKAHPS